jgi:hypothetical protein
MFIVNFVPHKATPAIGHPLIWEDFKFTESTVTILYIKSWLKYVYLYDLIHLHVYIVVLVEEDNLVVFNNLS